MTDPLRARAEAAAVEYCTCLTDYTARGRVDPSCRCDVWAEVIERFAEEERRAFAGRALRHLVPNHSERYFNHGDYTADYAEAIVAAKKE